MNTKRDVLRRKDGLKDNVALIGERRTRLRCGHETTSQPIATLGAKRWHECPEGCGLQTSRR